MPYRPLLVEIDASSSLLLALDKILKLGNETLALAPDERFDVVALFLQVAIARSRDATARVAPLLEDAAS